jgi:hypothetical protein
MQNWGGSSCEGPVAARGTPVGRSRRVPTSRLLRAARLQLCGYGVAAVYAVFLVSVYNAGSWILDTRGVPIYTDSACAWVAAFQAIHGHAAALYDPAKFVEMQAALVGPNADFHPNWPYPPIFLLILAPFAALGYLHAFIAWDVIRISENFRTRVCLRSQAT